jgi:tRNA-specific 2-thiouridylase
VPIYVLEKDTAKNTLIVGPREARGQQGLIAENVNWILGEPPGDTFRAQVKIRYKAVEAWGQVSQLNGGNIHIRFDDAQRDITPGQAAVIYQGDVCLGGGIIISAAD